MLFSSIRSETAMSPFRLLKMGDCGFVLLIVKPFTLMKPPLLSKNAKLVVACSGVLVLYIGQTGDVRVA
jgi:hypothetical protein